MGGQFGCRGEDTGLGMNAHGLFIEVDLFDQPGVDGFNSLSRRIRQAAH